MRRGPIAAVTWLLTTVLTILVVRVHAGDINDEVLTATQACKVTIVAEPEVDVALLKLGCGRDVEG